MVVGADVDQKNGAGEVALIHAAREGQTEACKLVGSGARFPPHHRHAF